MRYPFRVACTTQRSQFHPRVKQPALAARAPLIQSGARSHREPRRRPARRAGRGRAASTVCFPNFDGAPFNDALYIMLYIVVLSNGVPFHGAPFNGVAI